MDNNILSNEKFAIVKLERAKRMTMIFDQLNEKEIKNLLGELSQSMYRMGILDENYYLVNKLLNMDIRVYGGVVKAISWKEGYIIRKYDLMKIIEKIEKTIGYA